jgi:hypothetical protein
MKGLRAPEDSPKKNATRHAAAHRVAYPDDAGQLLYWIPRQLPPT